jgi:aspartyl-tRNA(Asn)/glutamyl-tRNA(Gln) amidotransferase subunit A
MALSWTLDKIGPMCRSAEDCGLVLRVIAGADVDDPESAGKAFGYAPQYSRKAADVTVGYAPVDFEEYADPSARAGFKTALEVIKSTGVKLKEVEIPDFPYGATLGTILNGEMGSIFETLIKSGKVDELADKRQIAGMKASLELPAAEYLLAMRIRSLIQEKFRELFIDVDVLLTPSRMGPASKITDRLDAGPPADAPRPKSRGLSTLIPAGNLCGLPAISLPCGFADQMPIAISLVSRPFYENELIALGSLFQKQTDWHRKRPPV